MDRILQSQGFGSRRYCRELLEHGEVLVNGEALRDWKTAVDPEGLVFTVFGQQWRYRAKVYLALNKPPGYECSRKPSHHPGVMRLLPEQFGWRDVQPVGRLDHDTTGLLLLSDDGAFIHAMSSPRRHVPKTYVAQTDQPLTPALLEALQSGVQLHDEPAPLAALSARALAPHLLEIVLEQGKYHQVKRMLAAAGNHCAALQRVAIGALRLDQLALDEGQWCYLESDMLNLLRQEG